MREFRGSAVVRSGTFTVGAPRFIPGWGSYTAQTKKKEPEREKVNIHVEYYIAMKNKLDFCFCQ